jgi:hypothetical protein
MSDIFDQMLAREAGRVGAEIRGPRNQRVGASIQYRGGVGAPVDMVPEFEEEPIEVSPTRFVAGEPTNYGLGFSTASTDGALPNQLLPAGSVVAPARASFTFRPDRPIRPNRFLMPSTYIMLFIEQIKIGGTNLLPEGSGGIPCEAFSEVSTQPLIKWLTINTTPGVTITVVSINPVPTLFTGTFHGWAVRE